MKIINGSLILTLFPFLLFCQTTSKLKNIFIITTDGFRWQEVFTGADSSLINNEKFTADIELSKEMFWDESIDQRRKKLMPFFWNVIAKKGQLYGNRTYNNKVNVKNVYKISYPGYNELLTGYADLNFIPNTPVNNKNYNILEYLNQQPNYTGKVAAFTSWNIFPYILNEARNQLPVNSGYEMLDENNDTASHLINLVQHGIQGKSHTRYDILTYLGAREYIGTQRPKILFLGLGETDESAHSNKYDHYLQKASMVDKMISDLWYYVQTDPYYKDNTIFIITTDHGRGSNDKSWHTHGLFTKNSGQTWLAMIGPGISPLGEVQYEQQIYANQLASTISGLLQLNFKGDNANGIPLSTAAGTGAAIAGARK